MNAATARTAATSAGRLPQKRAASSTTSSSTCAALAPLTVGLMNSSKPTAAATDPMAVQKGNRAANFNTTVVDYTVKKRS